MCACVCKMIVSFFVCVLCRAISMLRTNRIYIYINLHFTAEINVKVYLGETS